MVKILVPTDYSACSISALKHAASLTRGADGELLILHVQESGSQFPPQESDSLANSLRHEVSLLLQSLSQGNSPLKFEERHVEGIPEKEILATAAAENVDLIVMGTTGRTGLKRILMGSVAEEVSRRATCPVLILKTPIDQADAETSDAFWETWTKLDYRKTIANSVDALKSSEINDNPTLALISRAIGARASDIHIDPVGDEFQVRFRIDGQLNHFCQLSNEVGRALVTQLKVTGNLDIADPFHPKEGRLSLPKALHDFEVRITAVPVIDGEAISLRILSCNRLLRSMDELGLSNDSLSRIEQLLRRREGIVLVTGPTGSGKTTTLYSMLRKLDDGTRNIVSIEDPVEYDIPAFRQLQVDLKHGITMTNGLRTLLRLDPDVVLVGEIRDAEAAETSMRAASSGKYVFSSLHTRDVASTVTAIRDLYIDNRSLAANLAGVVSQRLLKRLCKECCRADTPTEREADLFRANDMQPPAEIRRPVGCPHCRGTGYYDRIGIFEVVTSDDEIVEAIEEGKPEDELRRLIRLQGLSTLEKDTLQKVADGILSFEECKKMTSIEFGVPQTS